MSKNRDHSSIRNGNQKVEHIKIRKSILEETEEMMDLLRVMGVNPEVLLFRLATGKFTEDDELVINRVRNHNWGLTP